MKDIILEFDSVSYCYHTQEGETEAVKDLSFRVERGEFFGIVGPSGCGKSTILSMAASLLKQSGGNILICGDSPDSSTGKVAYMLQHDHLFGWRTILKNCTIGLEIQHKLTNKKTEEVIEMLNQYGLGNFVNAYPHQLSGGMRQRAALVRTLALDPDILLLDEPFSALDYHTRLTVADEISSIIRAAGKTAILVTHDISEAVSMCDRVAVLSSRPATITSIYEIDLNEYSALQRRQHPLFSTYFNTIWKELMKNAGNEQ